MQVTSLMAKHIIKFFSPLGSHTVLVFLYQTVWQYSDVDPLVKNAIFSQYLSLCLGNDTRQHHRYYGMRIGNCTKAFEWFHFQ